MKFATAKEHRDYFQKHGMIEFEGLFSNDQLIHLNDAISQVLAERLNVPADALSSKSSGQLFQEGHDLWRSNRLLQKFVTQTRFGEIASDLVETKPLRLGYDQLFPSMCETELVDEQTKMYVLFLEQTDTLQELSSMQGVACGLLIALGATPQQTEAKSEAEMTITPSATGNVVFFKPTISVDWRNLMSQQESYFLIVYTQAISSYYVQPKDPHTHSLKKLGYIVHERLKDKLHPIVYR